MFKLLGRLFKVTFWIFVIIVAIFFLSGSQTTEEGDLVDVVDLYSSLTSLTYDDLARYPEENKGKAVSYHGQIVQKINDTALRVNISQGDYGSWKDTVYLELKGNAKNIRVLENDIIEFVGLTNGERTYRAILGNRVTIPRITAYEIRLLAKAGEPWPPKQITKEEARNIVLSSDSYQTTFKRYSKWWEDTVGTPLSNITIDVEERSFPDNVDRWWVITRNEDGDPDVRTQEVISSYGVDKITGQMYLYNNSEGFLVPVE